MEARLKARKYIAGLFNAFSQLPAINRNPRGAEYVNGTVVVNKKIHQSSDQLSDEQLFRQAVEGVTPLKSAKRAVSDAPRKAMKINPPEDRDGFEQPICDEPGTPQSNQHREPESSHRKNGVRLKTMQKLKRGHFKPADQFDLHNLDLQTATAELLKFITVARKRGFVCIRVIHGKGLRSKEGPILKQMTRCMLADHLQVLAYTACKPSDGGDGATDVLLKS